MCLEHSVMNRIGGAGVKLLAWTGTRRRRLTASRSYLISSGNGSSTHCGLQNLSRRGTPTGHIVRLEMSSVEMNAYGFHDFFFWQEHAIFLRPPFAGPAELPAIEQLECGGGGAAERVLSPFEFCFV